MRLALVLCVLAIASPALAQGAAGAMPTIRPLIVGHRGASGERPEHTAGSYAVAIAEGADFIEPDLVVTKDGVLIARHENEIGSTTDVAQHPEFAGRKATKTVDGQAITGWFTEDFTLAEIKTLRARERLPELRPGNAAYDGRYPVLTFQEVIDLARAEGGKAGRTIGVYAELKHPTYFLSVGLPMEARVVTVLKANGLATHDAPFFLECFETGALAKVRALAPVKTIFLMSDEGGPFDLDAAKTLYTDMVSREGLKKIAAFADGVGPAKAMIIPRDKAGRSLAPTTLVRDAHAAGLLVHPWTFRSENVFLPQELQSGSPTDPGFQARKGNAAAEYGPFFALGVDGLFSDFPAEAVAARKAYLAR